MVALEVVAPEDIPVGFDGKEYPPAASQAFSRLTIQQISVV